MPKEYIQTSEPVSEKLDPAIKIGWSGEGEHVQLAVVNHALDPDGMNDGVLHVSLNRYSINKMIRLLRRARNSAFGEDA